MFARGLRKHKLNMVHKVAVDLVDMLENRGFENEVNDRILRTHVPHCCGCFLEESHFGSFPEV